MALNCWIKASDAWREASRAVGHLLPESPPAVVQFRYRKRPIFESPVAPDLRAMRYLSAAVLIAKLGPSARFSRSISTPAGAAVTAQQGTRIAAQATKLGGIKPPQSTLPETKQDDFRRHSRRAWARLIRKVYLATP